MGRSVFSPDGRWLAYQQREGATNFQIYVQTYPASGTRHQISKDVGYNRHPLWSADGKELFYLGVRTQVVDVSVTPHPSFSFSILPPLPRPFTPANAENVRNQDILPDGKHFIGVVPELRIPSGQPTPAAPQIQVVLNWFEDVKQRMTER